MAFNWHNFGMGLINPVQQVRNIFGGALFEPTQEQTYKQAYDYARSEMAFSAQQAQIARDFNAAEAQKQRDFEERLANSSYQRMVEDARKAGLNPYLAYSAGGAPVPSGAAASGAAASYSGYAAAYLSAATRLTEANIRANTELVSTIYGGLKHS